MKKSIFFKIFSGYLIISLVLTTAVLLFSFNTIKKSYKQTTAESLVNLGITLKLQVIPVLEENKTDELDSMIKQLGRNINRRITIIGTSGEVLADSEENPRLMENHKTRPEIANALEGVTGISTRYSSTVKQEMLYVALPIEKEENIKGVLRISIYLSELNNLMKTLRIKILQIAIIIVIVSIIGSLLFSRSLSNPIRELVCASQKVAEGDFDTKIFLKKEDELKELADGFNYMTSEIKNLFSEISSQKEGINRIISSIQEGLFVLDKNDKIVLSNENFKKIVGNNVIEEKFYWEILRESQISNLINKVRNEKKNIIERINLNGKTFLCSVTFIESKEEIVLVLHDITEIHDLEKIKKDIVVNISHELKTPLTAIKGFTETLEEEGDVKNKRFLEIIKRHTDRLDHIIHDLLVLSELEDKEEKLEPEEVNLKNLVENIVTIFADKLNKKNLKLNLHVENSLPDVFMDPFRIEQMFINLIDNAIKYSEKGEITISMNLSDSYLRIEIEDQGIGIPEEHLDRIFERFYVVNKARSRQLGGTGLGLSIVKHIVLLHNGKIDIESNPDSGTKFTVTLPYNPA